MRLCGRRRVERSYPPYVTTEAERERWDLAAAVAAELFGDTGPDHVWMAARAIYRGPIPTGAPDDEGVV